MTTRPPCIVSTAGAPAREYRPQNARGSIECRVQPISDIAGLSQMGVKIREIEPGCAGSHLHYHDTEEEWAYILSGLGRLELGRHSIPVRAGHFAAMPPGPSPHHFIAEGPEPLVLIEGGDRCPAEDWCTYPELGVRSRNGVDDPIDVTTLPPPVAHPHQVVHLDDTPEQERAHPLTPTALRHMRALDDSTGLSRQACVWVRLEPEIESTTFHTHDKTDEWVYILTGEADVRIGDDWHPASEGDFIAHPAGGPAHLMRARTEIRYLMGGQSLPDDIVTYPERGMILGPGGFEKIPT